MRGGLGKVLRPKNAANRPKTRLLILFCSLSPQPARLAQSVERETLIDCLAWLTRSQGRGFEPHGGLFL